MVSSKLDGALATKVRALETAREQGGTGWPAPVKVLVQFTGDTKPLEEAGLVVEFDAGEILVGTIAVRDLPRLAELGAVVAIQSNRESRPVRYPAAEPGQGAGTRRAATVPTVTGKDVVLGVIDSGIDIFHPAFTHEGTPPTTRIAALFDLSTAQKISAAPNLTATKMTMRWEAPLAAIAPPELPTPVIARLPLPATSDAVRAEWLKNPDIKPEDIEVRGGPLPSQPITIRFTGKFDTDTCDSTTLPVIECVADPPSPGGVPDFTVGPFGVAHSRDDINEALRTSDTKFPFHDVDGHGTITASVAAGALVSTDACHSTAGGSAPGADLVIVRTPLFDDGVMLGTQFLLDFGATAAKPVVVTMSFTGHAGSHDGSDCLDVFLEKRLTGTTRRAIVAAAGNEAALDPIPLVTTLPRVPRYHNEGGIHSSGTVAAAGNTTVEFVIEHLHFAYTQLNVWTSGPGRLSFSVTAPLATGGESTPVFQPDTAIHTVPLGKHSITVASSGDTGVYHKGHLAFRVERPDHLPLSMGTWRVTLHETTGAPTSFHAWLTGKPNALFPTDRQDRSRTVGSPGTARNVLTVGAYDARTGRLGDFSSRGPTLEPVLADQRVKPEVCAPGVDIVTAVTPRPPLLLKYRRDFGTSLAAPYVAGVIALMFEANPALSYSQITEKLMATCVKPPAGTPPEDLAGWGAGRVDPVEAVKAAAPTPREFVLPASAYPPVEHQAAALRGRAEETPTGRTLAVLIERHTAEVRRLIDAERRVTVAWHRMRGPELLRLVLGEPGRAVPLPETWGGKPVADGISRLLDVLVDAGSAELRADIAQYRDLVLTLPGTRLADLDEQAEVG
ncbi:Subtilase family protein [Amycolatopsis xylanica]|uniref:Subtilase family protein n=1 Tax=Amycolatopsis xylanica TaxID=589385 RepID=A0A1H3RFD9_9PSEU|nr:S8 family serine peptidase [Amycolatopsis xylanica]SDZ23928.1 Subtilase family protein [Amycolatopsis xylanica]